MPSTPSVPCGCRRRSVGDPGLKIAQAALADIERNVRVTEDDQLRGRERGAHPPQPACGLAAVVDHGHRQAAELELEGRRRSPGRDVGSVVVAEHRAHRRVLELARRARRRCRHRPRARSRPRSAASLLTAGGQLFQRRGAWVSDSTMTRTCLCCQAPGPPVHHARGRVTVTSDRLMSRCPLWQSPGGPYGRGADGAGTRPRARA